MQWPPSTPIIDATLPLAAMRSTSSAVRASSRRSGWRAASSYSDSICSKVRVAASCSGRSDGTYTDQNCPPSAPGFQTGEVGLQRWARLCRVEHLGRIGLCVASRSAHKQVVVPVDQGRRSQQLDDPISFCGGRHASHGRAHDVTRPGRQQRSPRQSSAKTSSPSTVPTKDPRIASTLMSSSRADTIALERELACRRRWCRCT